MFNPTVPIAIQLSSGRSDVYGAPIPGRTVQEKCSVITLTAHSEKTAVRADTSASRGNAREIEEDAELLLSPKTQAQIDSIIVVAGVTLLIVSKAPQFDLSGRIDHFEVKANAWSANA